MQRNVSLKAARTNLTQKTVTLSLADPSGVETVVVLDAVVFQSVIFELSAALGMIQATETPLQTTAQLIADFGLGYSAEDKRVTLTMELPGGAAVTYAIPSEAVPNLAAGFQKAAGLLKKAAS